MNPLTIALVTEPASGGVGQHVADLAGELGALGHHVLLLYGTARLGHGFAQRLDALRAAGVHCQPLPRFTRQPSGSDLAVARDVRRALAAHARRFGQARIDVLHLHSTKAGLLGRTLLLGTAERVIYTPHAFYSMQPDRGGLGRRVAAALERALAVVTDRIIVVSRQEFEHARSLGISKGRLVQVENALALAPGHGTTERRREARRAFGIPANAAVVGFIGRLSDQKAPEVALAAMLEVLETDPAAFAVIVGDEPDPPLRHAIEAGPPRLLWLPQAAGRAVAPAFDVLLCTSRYEGFPYVFLEALDAAVPIVTTDVGGARDCVVEGRAGAVLGVPADDPACAVVAAAAVRQRLSNPQRRHRERAAAWIRRHRFALPGMVDRILCTYRSALSPRTLPMSDSPSRE